MSGPKRMHPGEIDLFIADVRRGDRPSFTTRLRRLRHAEHSDGLSEGYRFAMRQAVERARLNIHSFGQPFDANFVAWLEAEAKRS